MMISIPLQVLFHRNVYSILESYALITINSQAPFTVQTHILKVKETEPSLQLSMETDTKLSLVLLITTETHLSVLQNTTDAHLHLPTTKTH